MTIYLICSTIRTGSTLLCNYLSDTELAGNPIDYSDRFAMKAYFDDWKTILPLTREYIERLLVRFPSDPFGMKTPYQSVRNEIEHDCLEALFPEPPLYIYLSRNDQLKQAISAVRGMQTGKWYSNAEPRQPVMQENYSRAQIEGMMKELERQNDAWEDYFYRNELTVYQLDYEALTANPKKIVKNVLKYIGVEIPHGFKLPAPRLQKQADEINAEWEDKYLRGER